MAKAKSVTQRFAQSVKRIANKAAKATMKVLEPDKRTAKSRRPVVYPLAADGFVSDPMLFEPMPAARPAKTRAAKTGRRTRKPARKAAKKTSSRRAAVAKKRRVARGR
jgi:hypothetical protein